MVCKISFHLNDKIGISKVLTGFDVSVVLESPDQFPFVFEWNQGSSFAVQLCFQTMKVENIGSIFISALSTVGQPVWIVKPSR